MMMLWERDTLLKSDLKFLTGSHVRSLFSLQKQMGFGLESEDTLTTILDAWIESLLGDCSISDWVTLET